MRRIVSGHLQCALPASQAIDRFTPEGERTWVPGWDPVYAVGTADESPGTVYTTTAGDIPTIWLIVEIDRTSHRAAYARVTPGLHAGMVQVRCEEIAPSRSNVAVSYDMTLLPGADPSALDAYRKDRFAEMMREWEHAVAARLP